MLLIFYFLVVKVKVFNGAPVCINNVCSTSFLCLDKFTDESVEFLLGNLECIDDMVNLVRCVTFTLDISAQVNVLSAEMHQVIELVIFSVDECNIILDCHNITDFDSIMLRFSLL